MDLTVETLNWLAENNQPNFKEANGLLYSDKELNPVLPISRPALVVHTLDGFIEFITKKVEGFPLAYVHVMNEARVDLILPPTGTNPSREIPLCAQLLSVIFPFGQFIDAENFIIALQAKFEKKGDRDQILKVIGNIKEETVRTTLDDGITQTVTAKAGVAFVQDVQLPNPVKLTPYRTFLEVPQPESQFVLRGNSAHGKNEGPTFALFEADGGAWKNKAIAEIKKYLTSKIQLPVIG